MSQTHRTLNYNDQIEIRKHVLINRNGVGELFNSYQNWCGVYEHTLTSVDVEVEFLWCAPLRRCPLLVLATRLKHLLVMAAVRLLDPVLPHLLVLAILLVGFAVLNARASNTILLKEICENNLHRKRYVAHSQKMGLVS